MSDSEKQSKSDSASESMAEGGIPLTEIEDALLKATELWGCLITLAFDIIILIYIYMVDSKEMCTQSGFFMSYKKTCQYILFF